MSPRILSTFTACLLILSGRSVCPAAEPTVESSQLPRIPPTPPERALSTFRIKPGFRVDLVAAEPLVVDPVAMSFDEDGRLYVVEMRDYSERRPERLGRIRRLEDTDGDGHFDRSTEFAKDLPWPTAVICYAGGIFVGCTPDILWIRDLDGDGIGDEREVLFTGFAADYAPFATNKLNVQALMNSFNWSLDDRIQGATSFSGGKVRLVDSTFVRDWLARGGPKPDKRSRNNGAGAPTLVAGRFSRTLELRGRDVSFDPRRLEMRAESGGGQHGLSFDDWGHKFVCANSSHIQTLTYEERYAALNSGSALSRPLVEIAEDGGAAPVFRLSPDEPWRVLRTQWRVAGLVPGPIEGGGKPSGYFTGATGVTIYRGDAYGDDFVGDAFIGDAGGNLVHRKKVFTVGAGLKAVRPADERNIEFLASTDNWFRPVQFANAPDGCLYICDMYREVIEHPWSLPQSLKQHLDLNSGNDRGRIYRIVPESFRQSPFVKLSPMSSPELVAILDRANGWHRDTAARLLYERQDPDAIPALKKILMESQHPKTRLHALYALAGQNALGTEELLRGCSDAAPDVRRHAVRLSERMLTNGVASEVLVSRLISLARDSDVNVCRQLAFTSGLLSGEARTSIIGALMANDDLPAYEEAIFHSIGDEAIKTFQRLITEAPSLRSAGSLRGLARVIGVRHQSNEMATVVAAVGSAAAKPALSRTQRGLLLRVTDGYLKGLDAGGYSVRKGDPGKRLAPVFPIARDWVRQSASSGELPPAAEAAVHSAALSVLGAASDDESVSTLMNALENDPSEANTTIAALGRSIGPRLGGELLARWPRLTPSVRTEAMTWLLKRTSSIAELLVAIEKGNVNGAELSPAQRAFLRDHKDAKIRDKAVKLFGQASVATRQAVVDRYVGSLKLNGASARGRTIFQARCGTCHKLGNDGYALGPDLVTVRNGGKEKVLVNVIDPNRELNGNFAAYMIETRDGETLSGIIAGENASSVTLRMAGGTETALPRNRIASLQNQNRSLMPEGLEEGLSLQEMADLLEFVLSGP